VLETCELSVREAAERIAQDTHAEVVQVIGTKFVLYKRNDEDPQIVLPKAKKKK
ncbi:MAG: YhbY family RNA-binding protein, partial [Clostridia bacterium]|nr:YhbY family RNA-binding protein [Clostridia bacterium]